MIRGIQGSACVLVVLSRSYFSRPFCRFELVAALKACRPIIVLFETDERLGAFDFAAPSKGAPAAFHLIIGALTSNVNCLPLRRDEDELCVGTVAALDPAGHLNLPSLIPPETY